MLNGLFITIKARLIRAFTLYKQAFIARTTVSICLLPLSN